MISEERKKYLREYYLKNREKSLESRRIWREQNPEKMAAYKKKYYENNKALVIARSSKWSQDNYEYRLALNRAWGKRNKTKKALAKRARDAVLRNRVAPEEISNWYTRICGICSTLIEDKFHIDHIKPISKGGEHTVENLQLAHPSCNQKKSAKYYAV